MERKIFEDPKAEFSKSKSLFECVVLSGGGIKGLAQLGILSYYYESGRLDLEHVKEYCATSIGTIISLLMICGYSITDVLYECLSMTIFFELRPGNYGIFSLDPLIRRLENLILAKFPQSPTKGPTLLELYQLTGKKFTIAVTNVTKMKGEYFSYATHPDLGVIEAVQISCSLPFLFGHINYNGYNYVDGGLTDNFPIDIRETRDASVLAVLVMGKVGEVADNITGYGYKLIMTAINAASKIRTRNASPEVTIISMDVESTSLLDYLADGSKKIDMYLAGYHYAQKEDKKEILPVPTIGVPLITDGWDCEF